MRQFAELVGTDIQDLRARLAELEKENKDLTKLALRRRHENREYQAARARGQIQMLGPCSSDCERTAIYADSQVVRYLHSDRNCPALLQGSHTQHELVFMPDSGSKGQMLEYDEGLEPLRLRRRL